MEISNRIGLYSAAFLLFLELCYVVVLGIGLAALPSPDVPIMNPWFSIMEVLILLIGPALVILFSSLHIRTGHSKKALSLAALCFMLAVCILTTVLHFSILVLSSRAEFSGPPWSTLIFPFRWPSLAYGVDILAWDVFWPISLLFAALSMGNSKPEKLLQVFMILSAFLSALGLLGVISGNMDRRNIGIIGYVPVFMIILIQLIFLFRKDRDVKNDLRNVA